MRRAVTRKAFEAALWWLLMGRRAAADVATFSAQCSRACSAYETCFVYDGAEYCAPFCGPGRCNDATETCVVQGRACESAPCLPSVVCEPMTTAQLMDGSVGQENESPCSRQCPFESSPVCGSNGITYANECFFQQDQCVTPSISIAYPRICDADVAPNAQLANGVVTPPVQVAPRPECDAISCATVYDPVCTTDGTMTNICFMQKAQCVNSSIALLRRVACDMSSLIPTCPTNCTQEFVPVCGSNGVMYGNECFFRKAKCERKPWGELQARDLSDCYQQMGDSQGVVGDVSLMLASTV